MQPEIANTAPPSFDIRIYKPQLEIVDGKLYKDKNSREIPICFKAVSSNLPTTGNTVNTSKIIAPDLGKLSLAMGQVVQLTGNKFNAAVAAFVGNNSPKSKSGVYNTIKGGKTVMAHVTDRECYALIGDRIFWQFTITSTTFSFKFPYKIKCVDIFGPCDGVVDVGKITVRNMEFIKIGRRHSCNNCCAKRLGISTFSAIQLEQASNECKCA